MNAFVVSLNGGRLCTAGVGGDGVVSVTATWCGHAAQGDPGESFLNVSGLDSRTGEHVAWDVPAIGPGDVITIRVVEADVVDPPDARHKEPPAGSPPHGE